MDSKSSGDNMPKIIERPLTLIVAATRSMGIGKDGGLPWPMLKQEMGYFARVTKRIDASSPSDHKNAVIMGRKTWESIPPKLRPLKDRLNVVITRQEGMIRETGGSMIVAASLMDAVQKIDQEKGLSKAFVIGGASIYKEALEGSVKDRATQLLLTRIETEFECDTTFPLDPEKDTAWTKKSTRDLAKYTGENETDIAGIKTEKDVNWEFCLYERTA